MSDIQGPVIALDISQRPQSSNVLDGASVTLLVGSRFFQRPRTFTLWETVVGECIPPSVSIARSLNVSLLRDAIINKLEVVLTYSEITDPQGLVSEVVDAVRLLASGVA
jgi:hypothetical protein